MWSETQLLNLEQPMTSTLALESQLCDILRATPWFMGALSAVARVQIPNWCIGAGAVRDAVWDALGMHHPAQLPRDIDVAYFDPSDVSREPDLRVEDQLRQAVPDLPWEVTNQAGVHLWFHEEFNHSVDALCSLEEAVGSWPETATAVAVTLEADDDMKVIAPLGLEDLMGMVVRRNPRRVSLATYRARVVRKRYRDRWPEVCVVWG